MLLSGMELVDIHVPELRHSCQWHPGLDMFVFFSDSIAVLVFFSWYSCTITGCIVFFLHFAVVLFFHNQGLPLLCSFHKLQ